MIPLLGSQGEWRRWRLVPRQGRYPLTVVRDEVDTHPEPFAVLSRCRADLDSEVIEGPMPLIRYFIFTGGVLLALLFLVDRYMGSPENVAVQVGQDPVVRIHSAQRWPEKIVFDTSAPRVPPPDVAVAAAPSAPAPDTQGGTRQAFAMAEQSAGEPKRAAPPTPNKHVAQQHRRHPAPRTMPRDQPMLYGQFYGPRLSAGWW
ncbi:hypothetical protein [Bradyrhizobium sp. Cp5.3]|uniref:hypothetical protein n=1 Tax=Bradyrhizobium sp. Cp5.3 TaxID=443598 RepID=UPI0012EB0699|nr:hypothetical protein [Bradyrhizobium sp. Cp5.3]